MVTGLKVPQEVMSVGFGNVVHGLPETCWSLSYSRAPKMQEVCVFVWVPCLCSHPFCPQGLPGGKGEKGERVSS